MTRTTRRTSTAQPSEGKENQGPAQQDTTPASSKKARHRLSTTELTRLEETFKQDTHPSRQQKKDLAAELGMDYKTVTIWFQNKRQTSKRGQPPPPPPPPPPLPPSPPPLSSVAARALPDSGLRAVSSPSHNATLDEASAGSLKPVASELQGGNGVGAIAAKAIDRIKPLIDTLNALGSKPRGHPEAAEDTNEAPDVRDVDTPGPSTEAENAIAVPGPEGRDQTAESEPTKKINEKPVRWKRPRTLEWACERQSKRRKLSREAYDRLGSEEVQDHTDPDNARMESALSLLSLASSQAGPPKDVMRGVSLLLSFKHSWRRK